MQEKFQLTPVEFELMEILWKIGEGTVHDVKLHLSDDRELAYTSVSTILRILQQKKIVAVKKNGRQHIYLPLITKEKFATHTVKKIVKDIFSGSAVELVSYLMDKNELSADELKKIQKLLNQKKREVTA